MEAIVTIVSVAVAVAISLLLGNWLPMVLPQISPVLDRKPFNCRPCTTFHLTWLSIALVAFCCNSLRLLVAGVVIAFIVFFIVRKIDNNKILD